jgi:hypothetical protein
MKVNAIVEPTWHDNSCEDADQAPKHDHDPMYEEREHITLNEAIRWAESFSSKVTLYLYDEDDGIYPYPQAVANELIAAERK